MTELKTLKDFGTTGKGAYVFKDRLKAEAVKWVDKMITDVFNGKKRTDFDAIDIMSHFFNLTEDDLKGGKNNGN